MRDNKKQWIQVMCKGLFLFVGLCLVVSSFPVTADENGKDRKRNKSFASYGNYPHDFSGRGVLDDVSPDFVVISDSQYPLAPGAAFNIPGQTNVARSMLQSVLSWLL
jgi:hypothetical protein